VSRNIVNGGRRLMYTETIARKAGDLVFVNGFYGTLQDDSTVGRLATLILDWGTAEFKNVFGTVLAQGTRIFAAPTAMATTLQLFPEGSTPSGARGIGRVWATGPASSASAVLRVQAFFPNPN
jgi:predicted RecA/RadA family phage recombinase